MTKSNIESFFGSYRKNVNKIIVVLKVTVGIMLLIGLFFWIGDVREISEMFSNFRYKYLFVLLVLAVVLIWVSCVKWDLFIKERGFKVSMLRLMNLYVIGMFFNNFFPSTVGGDLARSYLLGCQTKSQSQSSASVFLERFTGLIALVFLALLFSVINFNLIQQPIIAISIASMSFLCLLLFVLIVNKKLARLLFQRFKAIPIANKILLKLESIHVEISFFKNRHGLLVKSIIYSIIFHLLTSVNVYLCCLSLNFTPSFLDIAVITPIILLLTIIPVSPGNIGVWEWSFSFLLLEAGAGKTQGLGIALTLRGISMLVSLIGGILFLLEKSKIENPSLTIRETLA